MNVSPEQPFRIIYSLFQHEYLGYIFESFAVQLDAKGRLSYAHQNISSKNAVEFKVEMDDRDFELIQLMDSMQQEIVVNHFQKKKTKPADFFLKVFDKKNGDKQKQMEVHNYVERRRKSICPLLKGKSVFEMGKDGEPIWKEIQVAEEAASALFHFYRNEENTHYFPTIRLFGEKIHFYQNGSYVLADDPAWIVSNDVLFTFNKDVNGKKLHPFFSKKFIEIPRKVEETYYEKFVAPLIESFDVCAKGFEIRTTALTPKPVIAFSEIASVERTLFSDFENRSPVGKILFELKFEYDNNAFSADKLKRVGVALEKNDGEFKFLKIIRDKDIEKSLLSFLAESGLQLKNSCIALDKSKGFGWLYANQKSLIERGFTIRQNGTTSGQYFLGEASINIEIDEGIDWFDIRAKIKFGEFEIPFLVIRKNILNKKYEIILPDGSIAIIPHTWVMEYSDLFAFSDEMNNQPKLNKVHVALVKDLQSGNHAQVVMSRKLQNLTNFDRIEEFELPKGFRGKLRSYQHAGFNWLKFLDEYAFGGCLADDMGLGKTVQTLAMLQSDKEINGDTASLLVMPTSLVYNWIMEAKKFTPKLRILNYTGPQRNKDINLFGKYNLVITSYGTVRRDTEILKNFYFNYLILDESQAIKNPDSRISKAVRLLKSRRNLILTGTPVENSTMDLWSQMSFINPGLLGSKQFFTKEFQLPIEKKKDLAKTARLNSLIKPFLLRREKSQVAKDLPDKMENIRYCEMSDSQKEFYETEKSAFKNKIFDVIEKEGVRKSQMLLLQGLTRLRQIANHPLMVDDMYAGDSGKLEDISYMIKNALGENHRLLIFSQFVKHLDLIRAFLDQQNIPFAYLDGSTRDRQSQVEKFQNENDIHTFLISLKAGGLGLNLTQADYVFILDPWWNPAAEAQAIDRAHRIGQTKTVFTYKFIARDTVEEKILKLQKSKLKLAGDLVTIEDQFVKQLSPEDISSLF
ncbi:MAG: DEAD/DEAH box helicase [Cytophagales bacterium]|nr:DEAD/DEAH box helicase [Cytophagales bacterium]